MDQTGAPRQRLARKGREPHLIGRARWLTWARYAGDISPNAAMLFIIIERFRNGDPAPVYRRFRDRGRLAPEGLRYVNSWVSTDLTTCYQVMECDDRRLLDQWIGRWDDIVDFEIIPAMTSAEAAAAVAPKL